MPERLKLFVVLAAFVGLRQGELLELRRADVDGITGRLAITCKVDKDSTPGVDGACADCGRSILKAFEAVTTARILSPSLDVRARRSRRFGLVEKFKQYLPNVVWVRALGS